MYMTDGYDSESSESSQVILKEWIEISFDQNIDLSCSTPIYNIEMDPEIISIEPYCIEICEELSWTLEI